MSSMQGGGVAGGYIGVVGSSGLASASGADGLIVIVLGRDGQLRLEGSGVWTVPDGVGEIVVLAVGGGGGASGGFGGDAGKVAGPMRIVVKPGDRFRYSVGEGGGPGERGGDTLFEAIADHHP